MSSKLKLLTLPILIIGLWLVVGKSFAAFEGINAANLSSPNEMANAIAVSSLTIPPSGAVIYVEGVARRMELPIDHPTAMLSEEATQSFESVSTYFVDDKVLAEEQLASDFRTSFAVLSSIKYSTANVEFLVTTTKPSRVSPDQHLLLGTQEVTLTNGVTAWATSYKHGEYPNRVIFVHNDLLVTVAGSIPLNDVQMLAADVVIR